MQTPPAPRLEPGVFPFYYATFSIKRARAFRMDSQDHDVVVHVEWE